MVFVGKKFWEENGLFEVVLLAPSNFLMLLQMVKKFAVADKAPFLDDLLLTDSNEEIIDALMAHAVRKNLPLTPLDPH